MRLTNIVFNNITTGSGIIVISNEYDLFVYLLGLFKLKMGVTKIG